MISRLRNTLAGLLLAALAPFVAHASSAAADEILLDTRPHALSDSVTPGDRLARIRLLGLLELPNQRVEGLRFSQLSALAWDDDEGLLYALSDKGNLFHLRPVLEDGRLTGVRLVRAVPLRGSDGKPLAGRRADAEGMDIVNGRNGRKGDAELIVSFERYPRIVRYRPDGRMLREHPLPAALSDPKRYRGANSMLEAVCVDERLGILTAPEEPLRAEQEGYTRIFDLAGRSWRYPLTEGMQITAIECLGNGELMVLERDFGRLFGRSVVALRRTVLPPQPSTTEPVLVTTVVRLDAAEGFRIDNFEGLARHRGRRFFMISDDNDLFVQRTLLMYFELLD